ncbi:HAD hydrolase-like protein [Acetobacter fallax]|uniref:HAD hydrolase-like protein n=1 Tax=Acetobacter fallax TaxID=1737473 RepID=A0ABX0K8B1_9PROT|nr:HAD hydrolase-like protein [Acetobacter fallax]NHO31063.1 HAD hydrolase-like protein [Acetobacter fallax]NHO34620.1 HAD hydrolase-like protein [Acetobacter fallax]
MTLSDNPLPGSAILFDLDGTIVDSRTGIIDSIHSTLRDLGHKPDLDHDLNWVVGPPLRDLIGEILLHYNDTRCDEAMEFYRRNYEASGMKRTPVFAGMREVIKTVCGTGARLFIATSKPAALARAILNQNDLLGYFTEVYGARPDDSGAEKPELIAAVLRDHEIDNHRAIMIGDRRFDISGAHANNIRALGVRWGYSGKGELEDAAPEAIVAEPDDLPARITAQLAAEMLHIHQKNPA